MPNPRDKQDQPAQPEKQAKPRDDDPPAGEGEAANDPPTKQEPGDDEETMPMEEGFSLVP